MKKLYLLTWLVSMVTLFTACNDEWTDELYTRLVSFKAPVNPQGVSDIYVRYKANGEGSYLLPLIVSGTQKNDQDLEVKISVDPDTLNTLNMEKYQYRTDLYYKLLGEGFYTFPEATCHIPAGEETATYRINFNFTGLDLVDKWVLPLNIEDTPSYTANKRKGWRKALLRLNLFNDYSGQYQATAMNIYFGDETNNPMVVDYRTLQVVDEHAVFFYAGHTWEEDEKRGAYKVIATFGQGQEDPANGNITGSLTLTAPNPDIAFEQIGEATYEIQKKMDDVQPYLQHYYVILRMQYKYTDVTSSPETPVTYRAQGTLTMERKINTLIPDEDQAIQWD